MTLFYITISYIIGILWGLYVKTTIVPFLLILFISYYFLPKNVKRYIHIIFSKKVFFLCIIILLFSNFQIAYKQKQYHLTIQAMKQVEEVEILAKVVSSPTEKTYQYTYEIEIQQISIESQLMQNKKILLQVKKQERILTYGEIIYVKGNWEISNVQRNFGGFDYQQYLQTQGIYGIVKAEEVQVISKERNMLFYIQQIAMLIKEKLYLLFPKKEADTLAGILIGDTSNLSKETEEKFRDSSLSHMLAVSRKSCSLCNARHNLFITKNEMPKKYYAIWINNSSGIFCTFNRSNSICITCLFYGNVWANSHNSS